MTSIRKRSALKILALAALFAAGSVQAAGKYVLISHAPDSDAWWNTIKNSIKQAGEDYGVTVDYRNPPSGDLADMARSIEQAAAAGYDGVIVTIADYNVLQGAIGKVTAKIGAGTNAKEASLDFTVRDAPNVDISVPGVGGVSNSAEVGVPTVFTLKLAAGGTYNALRNVRIDYGDGAGADLGAIALTGSTTVSHVYSRTGFFTVRVTATDVLGNVGTSTMALTVNDRTTVPINLTLLSVSNRIATFQANLGTGTVSGSIRFYDWDFGDGQSASTTGNTTSHRYSSPGNYTVNVRVVTTTGSEGFATIIVTVI